MTIRRHFEQQETLFNDLFLYPDCAVYMMPFYVNLNTSVSAKVGSKIHRAKVVPVGIANLRAKRPYFFLFVYQRD